MGLTEIDTDGCMDQGTGSSEQAPDAHFAVIEGVFHLKDGGFNGWPERLSLFLTRLETTDTPIGNHTFAEMEKP